MEVLNAMVIIYMMCDVRQLLDELKWSCLASIAGLDQKTHMGCWPSATHKTCSNPYPNLQKPLPMSRG